MDELVRQKAIVAFRRGVYSQEYRILENMWIDKLVERGLVRPPVPEIIERNGIQLKLQSIKGRHYRYVPLDKFEQSKFCIDPEPLRDFILSEIRIQSKALDEVKILNPDIDYLAEDNLEDF